MSAECLQTSNPNPQNSYPKFQNPMISLPGMYLKLSHFPVKIGLIGGVRGVLEIRFSLESSFFCYLGAHAKFHNPSCLYSGRKVKASEEERRKEKMPSTMVTSVLAHALLSDQCYFKNAKYYGHYVYASSHRLHKHSARTNVYQTFFV